MAAAPLPWPFAVPEQDAVAVKSWLAASVAEAVAKDTATGVSVTKAAGEFAVAVTSVTTDGDGGVTTITVSRHVPVELLPDATAGAALIDGWAAPAIELAHGEAALSPAFLEAMAEAAGEAVEIKGGKI